MQFNVTFITMVFQKTNTDKRIIGSLFVAYNCDYGTGFQLFKDQRSSRVVNILFGECTEEELYSMFVSLNIPSKSANLNV